LEELQEEEGEEEAPGDDPGHPTVDFHGEKRSHETHASTTDPEVKLTKKGQGKEAQLSYSEHVWIENHNGMGSRSGGRPVSGSPPLTDSSRSFQ
jgi:hypothetical protein